MDLKGLALFDIDGVIRDVGSSYRLALKKTVYKFCRWNPTNEEIDLLKSEGCWNNDWDASLELIKRHIKSNCLLTKVPNKENLINEFNKLYFGSNPNEPNYEWNGFINNEPLLISRTFFQELTNKKIGWGFVSGAEQPSARFVLERRLGLNSPPLIAMGDAPDKPDPSGLIRLSEKLLCKNLGKGVQPITYIGDTVADVLTIKNAREKCPNQIFISFAVAPPHLHKKEDFEQRKAYEKKLIDAGADKVLQSTNEILEYI